MERNLMNKYIAVGLMLANTSYATAIIDTYDNGIYGQLYGTSYVETENGYAVSFSRESESRIEYDLDKHIFREGTIEFLINVKSGYSYSNFVLNKNNQSALIFTTDIQGGDVTWPGSLWIYVSKDGTISMSIATSKYGRSLAHSVEAKNTGFKFGEWNVIGFSYGSEGQSIRLNGETIANAVNNTQLLGGGGTHEMPRDKPTIGESVSAFWRNNQHEGGFEGELDVFRSSSEQNDWLISKFSLSKMRTDFKNAINSNSITELQKLYAKYPKPYSFILKSSFNEAFKKFSTLVSNSEDISVLQKFVLKYADYGDTAEAIKKIFILVRQENNIEGFAWFVKNYTHSVYVNDALKSIYELAFMNSKEIGTLEAYNDFIISYPYSKQAKEAEKLAYDLENKKYNGLYDSDEKNSRALLIQLKRLERQMNLISSQSTKDGYILVINRMAGLLQDKYPAEDATLRYLESEEFKDFNNNFKSAIVRVNNNLKIIADNTEKLAGLLKSQSDMIDSHLTQEAYERRTSDFRDQQHQYWERYLRKYGL